ncbi:related to negative acting factor [Cephalotrichum gorgonifer]|uniref:Related to negative acting factor n=1 Tax=Cephalotrichum gorgonifer TaxID=2041049 RepID=A0AAE8MW59_9PEZI|nr:related to negative acting factor [Cephalotrichum gorgonifer]
MVYCGKPSRGCQMCRTRRIKCDEARPTCSQCAKSRRQCPGYRDEFDIVHRNETQATERRARKTVKKPVQKNTEARQPPSWPSSSSSSSPSSSSSSSSEPDKDGELSPASSVSSTTSAEVLVRSLGLPIQDRAACLFVANFILVPRKDSSRGYLHFVLPLMKIVGPKSPLAYAFGACAYASLGNRPNVNMSEITLRAVFNYHRALQALQRTLEDPEASKSDATLCAVLLLCLYEHITYAGMGVGNWVKHVEGAIRLAEARGRDQLRTKRGLLLFIAVRTQMVLPTPSSLLPESPTWAPSMRLLTDLTQIVHSMASGTTPAMGVEWWVTDAVNDQTATLSQSYAIRMNAIRAEVTKLLTANVRSPEVSQILSGLVRRMQALEHEITVWSDNLPEHWRHVTVAWEDNVPDGDYSRAEAFPGRVDIYCDYWIASVVNMARVTRLHLAATIVRCVAWICAPADYRTTPEYATCARISTDCITDIIASVPYHFSWHLKRPDVKKRASLSGFGCGDENAQKSLPGYFLNLPLVVVQNQDHCTDAQRSWVRGRLQYIATELGVRYSGVLAKLDVRVPSMYIRRDNLFARPYPVAHDFEKVLSTRPSYDPATQSQYPLDPFKHMEALRKGFVDQKTTEMISKAGSKGGKEGERLAGGFTLLNK